MLKKLPKLSKGFTLIELLVVVSVIGVLAGVLVVIIDPEALRGRARDTQRVGDLKQIQTSLELYFNDNRQYPDTGGSFTKVNGSDVMTSALESGYLNNVPTDPLDTSTNSDPCSDVEGYRYNYRSDGNTYILTAIMESDVSNDESMCTSLSGWSGCSGTPETDDFCYGVENP